MCIYTHTDPKIQILVHTDPGACPISLFLFPFFVKSFFVHWYRNLSACLSGNSLFKKKKWTGKMIIGNIFEYCKTQNSGLRSKEEKPRDPINQSSRCNTQECLLSVAQTRWLWSPGRQNTPTNSKLGKLFICKKTILSAYYIRVTKWLVTCLQSNPIGTNFAGFCSNLGARGLFSSPVGFLLGAYWLAGSRSPDGGEESHHFTGNRHPSPGRLPAPIPGSPT